MNGVPMAIITANLGHAGTRTTEKHYAHLSLSHVRDAIRAGAPKYEQPDLAAALQPCAVPRPAAAAGESQI